MPPEIEQKDDTAPNPGEALNLLKEINEKISAPPAKVPESQPAQDAVAVYNTRKAEIMKTMGWNENQFAFHEQEKLSAAAPIMKDMSLLRIEKANKDYDKLKEPFEKEIKRYETEFKRVITPELAEEVFFMVKGREMSAGRYAPANPDSQPKAKPTGREADPARPRISKGYSDADPGMSGSEASGGDGDASTQLSDREKEYVKIFGPKVGAKAYIEMREEKRNGIRAIADKSWRAPEIDRKSAGPADRDLDSLWHQNGGELV